MHRHIRLACYRNSVSLRIWWTLVIFNLMIYYFDKTIYRYFSQRSFTNSSRNIYHHFIAFKASRLLYIDRMNKLLIYKMVIRMIYGFSGRYRTETRTFNSSAMTKENVGKIIIFDMRFFINGFQGQNLNSLSVICSNVRS